MQKFSDFELSKVPKCKFYDLFTAFLQDVEVISRSVIVNNTQTGFVSVVLDIVLGLPCLEHLTVSLYLSRSGNNAQGRSRAIEGDQGYHRLKKPSAQKGARQRKGSCSKERKVLT